MPVTGCAFPGLAHSGGSDSLSRAAEAQESGPSGFQLAFAGEASHRLQFQYGAEEAVELQVSVGYPAGGARTLRQLLDPGAEGREVGFDLGPLLAHGPYRPIPAYTRKGPQAKTWRPLRTGWWVDTQDPGKYLVTVMGRRVRTARPCLRPTFGSRSRTGWGQI